jgi:DNA modification methylase
VFREVRRVLRPDGTLWLNCGDSYCSDSKGSGGPSAKQLSNAGSRYQVRRFDNDGLKPKDLVGIPWRVAFAMQADGWYLRQDIIWQKPNPMPESVTDRPTKSHEYVFLMSKSQRYFYDAAAIAEPAQQWTGQAGKFERTGPVSQHVLPGQSAAQGHYHVILQMLLPQL